MARPSSFRIFCCLVLAVTLAFVVYGTKKQLFYESKTVPLKDSRLADQKFVSKSLRIARPRLKDFNIGELQQLTWMANSEKLTSTGTEFTGDRIRNFVDNRRKFMFTMLKDTPSEYLTRQTNRTGIQTDENNERTCTYWAVVTTIHEPSEAVRRMLYLINKPKSKWCMVIVGNLESPPSYEFTTTLANHKNVVYLDSKEQKQFFARSEEIDFNFIDSLPWQAFGRKNIGFLYAITQRPNPAFIWDFDDFNQLKFWIDCANMKKLQSLDNLINYVSSSDSVEVLSVNTSFHLDLPQFSKYAPRVNKANKEAGKADVAFNPYPVLGCPLTKCWPRGFPLSQVGETDFSAIDQSSLTLPHNVESNSISIIQSLADHKPDVDAVFRSVVSNEPFSFEIDKNSYKTQDKLLIIPKGFVVPMNAQATLHARSAYFGLYLPWTVNGRVSDIWRSYIAQALLSLTDHVVAFAPLPLVDQDRNTDYGPMADFDAEHRLYLQTDALITCLTEWKLKQYEKFSKLAGALKVTPAAYFKQNLAALMEDLYIDLYERRFVEEGDVLSVQYWLQLLTCYGYIQYRDEDKRCQNSSWNFGIKPVLPFKKLKEFEQLGNPVDDYTVSTCPNVSTTGEPRLTFMSADTHRGSRIDLPTLVASLGHRTILVGLGSIDSKFPKAFTRKYSVSKKDSLVGISTTRSNVVKDYNLFRGPRTDTYIEENYNFYTKDKKGKKLMDQVDVFTSSFSPPTFQMWKYFLLPEKQTRRRSVIINPAHRYNLGRCTLKKWNDLNQDIKQLLSVSSRIHIAGAMERYDLEYMHHYTGIKKSSNGYKSAYYGTENFDQSRQISLHLLPAMAHFYTRPEIERNAGNLQYPKTLLTFNLNRAPKILSESLQERFNSLQDRDIQAVDVRTAIKGEYELSDLIQYGAILYYPYSVMSYKFTEFYSLNIPLMVPSVKYFRDEAAFGNDRTSTSDLYCKSQQLGLDMPKASNSAHQYNPNIMVDSTQPYNGTEEEKNKKQHELYWLQFSDFYDWPHVTYFDNASHAGDLFVQFAVNNQGQHFDNIRNLMEEENKMRRYFALVKTFCPILEDIFRSVHGSS